MSDLTALSRKSGISIPVLQAIASAGQRHAQRVVLYGSRARGDHQPESDIDIAFFGSNEGFFRFVNLHGAASHPPGIRPCPCHRKNLPGFCRKYQKGRYRADGCIYSQN